MKRIVIVALMFGLTASAGAGLQFLVDGKVVHNGDDVLTDPPTIFSIANDEEETKVFDGGIVALDVYSEFGEITMIPDMLPGRWSIIDISADFGRPALFISWDYPAVEPLKVGKLIDFEIIWKYEATVEFYDISLEPILSVTLFTPEPSTAILFGLGLTLIRRKIVA